MTDLRAIKSHQSELRACRLCPDMIAPVITCRPITSKILLIGQAPGDKEGAIGQPFAWTAGKTLFKWFDSIGVDEETFRANAYMSAVCRCFPGKNPKSGDRVPSKEEIKTCEQWVKKEIELLSPDLIILVGKLAIAQYMEVDKLVNVIGKQLRSTVYGHELDIIPLPHPSGASTWHRMEPGKSLLEEALDLLQQHRCWQTLLKSKDL